MNAASGVPPLPAGWTAARPADWLDRLWEDEDLAPAPAVRWERAGGPACTGVSPKVFYPKACEQTQGTAVPSAAERTALEFCGRCPVRDWCLERDLLDSSTPSKAIGVRGGLRQGDRWALHVRLFGKRPRNGAPS